MFFKKEQKKKVDPKIRFQQDTFTKQVADARGYKRKARTVPETSLQKFLFSIGLDSWPRRLWVGGLLLVLVYLTYVPNFFSLKNIEVDGVAASDIPAVQETVRAFAKTMRVFPQRNLLFLNTKALGAYLEEHSGKVLTVVEIKKDYLNTLRIKVEPQLETFTLLTNREGYIIDNSGSVVRVLQKNEQGQVEIKGVLVVVASDSQLNVGKQFVDNQLTQVIRAIRKIFPDTVRYGIDRIEIRAIGQQKPPQDVEEEAPPPVPLVVIDEDHPLKPLELILIAKQTNAPNPYTFEILLDTDTDMQERMEKVSLLLQQFPEERRSQIKYIDMRFENKGFVCFKGSVCAEAPKPVEPETDKPQDQLEIKEEIIKE